MKNKNTFGRDSINKTITINGMDHTIDANNYGRIFNITDKGCLILEDTVLINSDYSAILNNGNCTMQYCNFIDNAAGYGGAICNYGNCTVFKCNFINNTASVDGGSIENYGNLTVKSCEFVNSTTYYI